MKGAYWRRRAHAFGFDIPQKSAALRRQRRRHGRATRGAKIGSSRSAEVREQEPAVDSRDYRSGHSPLSSNHSSPRTRHAPCFGCPAEVLTMLLALAVILLIAWLLGLVAFHVTAWFIHLLIVVAIIVAILHFLRGRP